MLLWTYNNYLFQQVYYYCMHIQATYVPTGVSARRAGDSSSNFASAVTHQSWQGSCHTHCGVRTEKGGLGLGTGGTRVCGVGRADGWSDWNRVPTFPARGTAPRFAQAFVHGRKNLSQLGIYTPNSCFHYNAPQTHSTCCGFDFLPTWMISFPSTPTQKHIINSLGRRLMW